MTQLATQCGKTIENQRMAAVTLRPYQQEALDAVISEYKHGINRQLISLPTGAGKSVMVASIVKHYGKKTLIIAHRDELIQQMWCTTKRNIPGTQIGICKGEIKEIYERIVIGSVQTCSNKKTLEKLKKQNFDILIIDEAHHSPAKSYQTIIEELGFKNNPDKLLIGVTATPERSDHLSLNNTFEKTIYSCSTVTLIEKNYLSPVIGRRIRTDVTVKNISTYMGDYAVGQLATAVNIPKRNAFIVQKYLQHAAGRKGVSFCVDVNHAQALATAFRDKGIAAVAVWGSMPMPERKRALYDLKMGNVQVVTSCGILTEGFDEPSITAIIMARPTKSKGLYIQCVGRGLRLYPSKENCFVLDFTDNGHTLNSSITLETAFPELKKQKVTPSGIDIKREQSNCKDVEITEVSDTQLDLLVQNSNFKWVQLNNGEYSLSDNDNNELVITPINNGFVGILYSNCKIIYIVPILTSFDECRRACEDIAKQCLNMTYAETLGDWIRFASKTKATDSQLEILRAYGIDTQNVTKAEASFRIRKVIALNNQKKRNQNILQRNQRYIYNNSEQRKTGLN